jgi:hypothetical protein
MPPVHAECVGCRRTEVHSSVGAARVVARDPQLSAVSHDAQHSLHRRHLVPTAGLPTRRCQVRWLWGFGRSDLADLIRVSGGRNRWFGISQNAHRTTIRSRCWSCEERARPCGRCGLGVGPPCRGVDDRCDRARARPVCGPRRPSRGSSRSRLRSSLSHSEVTASGVARLRARRPSIRREAGRSRRTLRPMERARRS